jgi:hypothetical protein
LKSGQRKRVDGRLAAPDVPPPAAFPSAYPPATPVSVPRNVCARVSRESSDCGSGGGAAAPPDIAADRGVNPTQLQLEIDSSK